jgi:hypothetical protein
MTKGLVFSGVTMAVLMFSVVAKANDGMPSEIHQLVQKGSNVEITMEIWDPGDPGMHYNWSLDRVTATETVPVFENVHFTPEDADSVGEPYCRVYDFAVEDPEAKCATSSECIDCDGDGKEECWGYCEVPYYFTFTDYCVPGGEVTYLPSILMHDDWIAKDWLEESLVVTPWDPPCNDEKQTDSDPETGDEDNPKGSGGTVNCSLVRVGFENGEMSLLGLLTLLF